MVNEEHITLLQQCVTTWNMWRDNNPDIKPNLSEAILAGYDFDHINLSQANLRGVILCGLHSSGWDYFDYYHENIYAVEANFRASDLRDAKLNACHLSRSNFSNADLQGAELCWTDLKESKFCNANLSQAKLSKSGFHAADLRWANLRGADLTDACFDGANFSGACLESVDLCGADLSYANLIDTDFNRADLSQAKNLTEAQMSTSRLCKTKLPKGIALNPDRDCIDILKCVFTAR